MLILSRRPGEKIIINENIEIKIIKISGNQVRIATTAPKDVSIHREEVQKRIDEEKAALTSWQEEQGTSQAMRNEYPEFMEV